MTNLLAFFYLGILDACLEFTSILDPLLSFSEYEYCPPGCWITHIGVMLNAVDIKCLQGYFAFEMKRTKIELENASLG